MKNYVKKFTKQKLQGFRDYVATHKNTLNKKGTNI